MNHFLITRFNLKNLWNYDKNHSSVRTEAWTQQRFTLFEKYCLPSVAVQTNKNFKWICLFADDTSVQHREKIDSYVKKVPQLIPFYLNDHQTLNLKQELIRIIEGAIDNKDFVITTRLDNDDTIHKDFIRLTQEFAALEKDHDAFYTFRYGYQYFEDLNVAVKIPYFNNHFLSRVESGVNNLKTVMDVNHFLVYDSGKAIKNISDKPMWIEVIHGNNVDNDIKLTLKIRPILHAMKFSDFGLNIRTASRIAALSIFSTAFSVRFVKQVKRRFINKIRTRTSK